MNDRQLEIQRVVADRPAIAGQFDHFRAATWGVALASALVGAIGMALLGAIAGKQGVSDTALGTGLLLSGVLVVLLVLLWQHARHLKRTATAHAAMEAELRSAALFPRENPAPIMRAARDGRLLFANPAATGLLKKWQCELGGLTPEAVREAVARTLREGRSRELEIEDGARTLSFILMPIPERDYVNLYGRDISEHKRVERELRETEGRAMVAEAVRTERQRFDELLTMLPVYVILLSPDYHVPFANRFFEQRFGKSNGKRCFEYLFNRSEPCVVCETFKVLKTNAPLEWEWTGPDGRTYEIHDFPFTDADGSPLIMEVGVDVTERKRAEAALKEANERLEQRVAERTAELRQKESELREAQRVAHIGSWYWNANNDVTTGSPELLRIFGLDPETQSMPAFPEQRGLCYPAEEWERLNAAAQQTLQTGAGYELDVRGLRNGLPIAITARGELVRDANGERLGLRGTIQDITDRKRAEQEKTTAAEFLALVNASRGRRELIESSVRFFQQVSGCEAVGIRLQQGDDYPYQVTRGFPERFLRSENPWCDFGTNGEIKRDANGNPVRACRCGNVISGIFDPNKPFFTRQGSFWTNELTSLLRSGTPTDRRAAGRNRCNVEGFESLALVPLHHGEQRLGLLQLNDRRKGLFSLETIQLWERLTGYLAAALAKVLAEEALRESERFHRQTLESIPGMVFTTRPDGYCDYQSQQWVDYTGVPMNQHLGDGWNKLLHPEDQPRAYDAWRAAVAGRAPYDLEYRVRRHDGLYQWFKVIGRPIRDGSGRIVRWFGVAANIDDLKRKDEALRAAKAELARANAGLERQVRERTAKLQEMVGELEHFSYTITHDMRAPLRAMHGFGAMVSELCAGCLQPEPKQLLQRIMTAAERMDLLITDALNYSKAVRQELPLAPVDPGALLRGMLDSYPELQPSRASIRIEGELPLVLGNEAGLTQCFSNLLANAVKFVAPGTTPHVRIRGETRPGWVRLWFEDNGIGIPEAMRPRVFDMFCHGSVNAGTGIGLALVRKVMDRMSGRVGVESQEGKGSRFWLDLRPGDRRKTDGGRRTSDAG